MMGSSVLHALSVAGLLFVAAANSRNMQQHTVSSLDGTTKLTLGPAGGLASVSVRSAAALGLAPSSGFELRVDGAAAGSSPPPVVTPLADGGVSFSREAAFGARKQHTATVTEAFRPAEDGAVEWSLTLKGSSANMFAPAIDVRLDAVAGGAVAHGEEAVDRRQVSVQGSNGRIVASCYRASTLYRIR